MCLQYIDIKQKKLKQFYHNPRVGGSSPSSATSVDVLKEWYRVLEPEGILRLAVPNFVSSVRNIFSVKLC
jgi:hypothetical protein